MTAVHLVLNEFTHDARVARAAETSALLGHETHVLAMHGPGRATAEDRDGMAIRRVRLVSRGWPKWRWVQALKYVEAFARIVAAGRGRNPTFIHANDLPTLPMALAISAGRGVPVLYDAHELWTEVSGIGRFPVWVARVMETVERFGSRRVTRTITVSQGIAKRLASKYGIPEPAVVRNMPTKAVGRVDAGSGPGPMRQRFGLGPDVPVILYQGGLSPGRGLHLLVEAAGKLEHPDAVVVFLGSGPLEESLAARVREKNLSRRVFLHPAVPLDELPGWTADATLGVHPIQPTAANHIYCLPNKLFEYVQAGLPVVMTDLPDIREVIVGYGVGEVVPPDDVGTLAGTLDRLLADPELYDGYSRAARAAAEELNWDREREALMDIYRSLVNRGPR